MKCNEDRQQIKDVYADRFWNSIRQVKEERKLSLTGIGRLCGLPKSVLNYALWPETHAQPNLDMFFSLMIGLELDPTCFIPTPEEIGMADLDTGSPEEEETDEEPSEALVRDAVGAVSAISTLQKSKSMLSQKQLKAVFIHALSYFDCSIEDLEKDDAPDRENASESGRPDDVHGIVVGCVDQIRQMIMETMEARGMTRNAVFRMVNGARSVFNAFDGKRRNPNVLNVVEVMTCLRLPVDKVFRMVIGRAMEAMTMNLMVKNDRAIDSDDYVSRIQNVMTHMDEREKECIRNHILGMLG